MRAALYIDCDSIEAKAVPVIYEDIIRTDKLVICKMFNSDKDDDSFVEREVQNTGLHARRV